MVAPVNTVAPAVTGTVEVGEVLTSSTGTWTGGVDSYAYQWQTLAPGTSPAQDVAGAVSNSYVVQAIDQNYTIRCVVTATNADGSADSSSQAVGPVATDFLVVEDGSAKPDANTFASLAAADAYHAARNNAAWAAKPVGDRKAALVRATDYMEQMLRLLWKGSRLTGTQALSWPRAFVPREDYYSTSSVAPDSVDGLYYYPSDLVPSEVVKATAEYALRAVSGALAEDLGQRTKREKVDVIEVEYDTASPQYTTYRAIDNMLAPLMTSGASASSSMKVVRC